LDKNARWRLAGFCRSLVLLEELDKNAGAGISCDSARAFKNSRARASIVNFPKFSWHAASSVTEALVRLLIAGPLTADPGNLQFFPKEGGLHYDDHADGERMARIHAALPSGSAALTSVLFFDKINRDKKGFSTGEGAILVGGFYKRYNIISFYTCAL
jgi:hypothetical protein